MLDFQEAWDNTHDPQRREPAGVCWWCGGEIYSEETLERNKGLCDTCAEEIERVMQGEDEVTEDGGEAQ